jgi:cellulose synthase/poly-beta-1,6-N-acetylglucosamine synthase-like glycosyltransferase
MAENIRISVCVPTYNRARMLRAAIDSAMSQFQPAEELLIVDNDSTDDTPGVLARYASNPRVRIVRNEKTVSLFENHNVCVKHARGDWIVYLHSDDRFAPDAMEVFHRYKREHPEIACFLPASDYLQRPFLNNKPLIAEGVQGIVTFCRWPGGAPTGAMYKKSWLAKMPFPREGAGDMMLHTRMIAAGAKLAIIPEATIQIGEGKFQTSHKWVISGQFLCDVADIFREMMHVPNLTEEIAKGINQWSAEEISRCLMFLAYADQGAAIDRIEAALGDRSDYKKIVFYRHVRLYKRVGIFGLRLALKSMKMLRGLKPKALD